MSSARNENLESELATQELGTAFSLLARLSRWFVFLGWLASVATFVALLADLHWLADMLTHLATQYWLILLIAVAVALYRRIRWSALIFGVALIWNSIVVYPSFVSEEPVFDTDSGSAPLRLVVLNVLRTNSNLERTWNDVLEADADFVFLMEVHPGWNSFFEAAEETYPFQENRAHHAYTGVAFLSRRPWQSLEVINSGVITNPSIDVRFSLQLEGVAKDLRLQLTHPVPPFGADLTKAREQQLTDLATRLVETEANLLAGDFNVSPWSPSFQRIKAAGNLRDVANGYGPTPTLGPLPTWFGGLKFDHVLANDHIKSNGFEIQSVSGSDHRMLIYDFSVAK